MLPSGSFRLCTMLTMRADLKDLVGLGLVDAGVVLGGQENLLVAGQRLFQCAHARLPANHERRHHVRKDDDISNRHHGEFLGFEFLALGHKYRLVMSGHSYRSEEEELIPLVAAISACRCWGSAAPRWSKDITRSKAAEANEALHNVQLSGNLSRSRSRADLQFLSLSNMDASARNQWMSRSRSCTAIGKQNGATVAAPFA